MESILIKPFAFDGIKHQLELPKAELPVLWCAKHFLNLAVIRHSGSPDRLQPLLKLLLNFNALLYHGFFFQLLINLSASFGGSLVRITLNAFSSP